MFQINQGTWGLLSLLFLFLSSLGLIFITKPTTNLAVVDDSSFYSNFENLAFTDQNNHPFHIRDLKDKVTLFNFIFTQCSTVCSTQTKALVEVQKALSPELRKKVQLVSVSLDPFNDNPTVLKSFAKRMGANLKGWFFITGKPQGIQQVADRLKLFGNEKQAKRPDDHTTNLWLIDENGRLMQRYSGNPLDVKRVAREIGQLHEMHVVASAKH